MKMRNLGPSGPTVSALGLGAMGMSDFYGPADEAESRATLDAALNAGVTLIDTADFYGSGHNEMLIAEAIAGRRDKAFIQVKFGVMRDPGGGFIGGDYRPVAIKNALAQSLRRLKTDHVDLYQPARVPADIPIEEVVGAVADLQTQGYVRHIGLSEAGPETIRRAHRAAPITALQIEYSLISRTLEGAILRTCRELGLGVTAYGVLSRGLLSGRIARDAYAGKRDFRAMAPRFQGDNMSQNLALVETLRDFASQKSVTPGQLAIAWALHKGDDICPMIGARRRDQLTEALGALEITLSQAEIAALETAMPASAVAGDRYDAHGMAMLDSEK